MDLITLHYIFSDIFRLWAIIMEQQFKELHKIYERTVALNSANHVTMVLDTDWAAQQWPETYVRTVYLF